MSERQVAFAVFAAMAAPVALVSAGMAWPAVLLGASAAALGLTLAAKGPLPRGLRYAYLLWCVLLMGKVAAMSRACFQDAAGIIPVVLLGLAALGSRQRETIGRLGALLWPAVAALILGLLAFSVSDFKWARFAEMRGNMDDWGNVAALCLSPMVLCSCVKERKGLQWGGMAGCVLGILVSVICSGVLGNLQGVLHQPLYDMVRGVSVRGVAERLESLLSVALCVSFFVALSLLCSVGVSVVTEEEIRGHEAWWVALGGLAVSGVINEVPDSIWVGLSVILGVLVPIICRNRPLEKNRGFFKNNA